MRKYYAIKRTSTFIGNSHFIEKGETSETYYGKRDEHSSSFWMLVLEDSAYTSHKSALSKLEKLKNEYCSNDWAAEFELVEIEGD